MMRWNLHGTTIEGLSNHSSLLESWQTSFASLPHSAATPHLQIQLDVVESAPTPPAGEPQFQQGELLSYYVAQEQITVHFPRFGQLQLDLAKGTTDGRLITAVLHTYGVLEDMIAISLSPHLRRRGQFLIHAFAAAWQGRAALLVGGIGAGKTTTGMALLNDGWQLLSNDSPVVLANGRIAQYPGVLAAYAETFARFESTHHLTKQEIAQNGRRKLTISAEGIWPDVWLGQADIGAICFPQIEKRPNHALERLTPSAALARLLPHAMEQWDKAMMPAHLTVLRQLVEAAPAYILHLGPDVGTISAVLRKEAMSD